MKEPQPGNLNRWMVWLPLLLAAMLVVGITIGLELHSRGPVLTYTKELPAEEVGIYGHGKLEELLRYIEAKYVDSVDREELVQAAIDEMLEDLDPHSTYLPAEQVRQEAERLEGNFDGIGIEFMVMDDTVRVVHPIAGGPSAAAGIQAGDNIVTIEDTLVAGVEMETSDIMRRLRGQKGSKVRIGILRPGEDKLREMTITRDQIPMESVDAAYMIHPGVAYVRINRFSATTSQEFNTHLRGMADQEGMQDLIIDLRQNPGGYLREATSILSQLFPKSNQLLVYTEGRASERQDHTTTGRALFDIRNVVVLIDEGSASASEILAGAVQDNDRGVIVGRRSYGKGLVQEQYNLSDGSAIRLTVARYYIPSGRSIQKPYDDRKAYVHDLIDRQENGELFYQDSLPKVDTLAYYTSSGRKVYGGGGIFPDVFVPLDSVYQNPEVIKLQAQIAPFVFSRFKSLKERYEGLDFGQFQQQFRPSDALLDDLIDFAARHEVEIDRSALEPGKEALLNLVKARLTKQLYGNAEFFRVLNERDDDVAKALEIITRPNPLSALTESKGGR
jgi:carboxyl-terminal processing protease